MDCKWRSERLGRVAALAALAAVLSALPATAGEGDRLRTFATSSTGVGPGAVQLSSGLYEAALSDGYRLTTHGPDPVLPEIELGPLGPGGPERPPHCATSAYQHVLYGYPAVISKNRLDQLAGEFRAHIRRMNALLNEAAIESGGAGADYRFLCDGNGEIRIDTFTNDTIVPYFTNIVTAARAAGFRDPDVDYTIFYDGNFPGICGFGSFADDARLTADNRNNTGGYGVTYESCWFSRTPMHENGHTQGAVQGGAPKHDGTNHCTDHQDVMCYPSSSRPCPGDFRFDCGYDTYFDAAPEEGEWLASHWNLGSPLNRYIDFASTGLAP